MSGQHHAPAALYPRGRTPGTHCTGGWVGPRAGLDTEARGKILCPCRGSNPGRKGPLIYSDINSSHKDYEIQDISRKQNYSSLLRTHSHDRFSDFQLQVDSIRGSSSSSSSSLACCKQDKLSSCPTGNSDAFIRYVIAQLALPVSRVEMRCRVTTRPRCWRESVLNRSPLSSRRSVSRGMPRRLDVDMEACSY
jgi:hypothetical protein